MNTPTQAAGAWPAKIAGERGMKVTTAARLIADRIRDAIREGDLVPGSRLRQQELARAFGVSTTPVREALRLLSAEGIVTLDEHRGAEVFQPTMDDVTEYYEMREVLETLAIERAVPKMTDEMFATLDGIIAEMDTTVDNETYRLLNQRFHSTIYQLSGRPRLCAAIQSLSERTAGYSSLVIGAARDSGRSRREHGAILEACKRGDVDGAKIAVRDHLRETVRTMTEYLSDRSAS